MFFTGAGDKGETSFFGSNKKVPKDSLRVEALGAVDEVNSFIGLCKARARDEKLSTASGQTFEAILEEIQQNLFIIQAELAGADKSIAPEKVTVLGELINSIEREMPPLRAFTVSGASELSALLDVARTIARRAERATIRARPGRALSDASAAYLNRLSSVLFALARLSSYREGTSEERPTYR
jgi:cob(I)alamin adenosyltransferase